MKNAPLKCQLCPYFYMLDEDVGYECQSLGCALRTNDKLRKEIYNAISKLKGE